MRLTQRRYGRSAILDMVAAPRADFTVDEPVPDPGTDGISREFIGALERGTGIDVTGLLAAAIPSGETSRQVLPPQAHETKTIPSKPSDVHNRWAPECEVRVRFVSAEELKQRPGGVEGMQRAIYGVKADFSAKHIQQLIARHAVRL